MLSIVKFSNSVTLDQALMMNFGWEAPQEVLISCNAVVTPATPPLATYAVGGPTMGVPKPNF